MRHLRTMLCAGLLALGGCAATAPAPQPALMGSASDRAALPAVAAPTVVAASLPFRPRLMIDTPSWSTVPRGFEAWEGAVPDVLLPPARPISPDSERARRTTALAGSLREDVRRHRFPVTPEFLPQPVPDPLGDAFVGNWDQSYIPNDRFVPLTRSLDLSMLPTGSIYGRAWGLDEELRGIGVGMMWKLPDAWSLGAEVGVDPFTTIEEGRFAVLVGVSRRF